MRREALCDGLFPLMTNEEKLSLKEALLKYKYQPFVEKRHEQLKSVFGVTPMWLKNVVWVILRYVRRNDNSTENPEILWELGLTTMQIDRFRRPNDPALGIFIMRTEDDTHTGILHRMRGVLIIQDVQ